MKKYEQVAELLERGSSVDDIMREMNISRQAVHSLTYFIRNKDKRRQDNIERNRLRRRKLGMLPWDERSRLCAEKHRPIIEAVDAGLSYRQVAEKFGLKSRNVVAGIVSRRPEARGVTA